MFEALRPLPAFDYLAPRSITEAVDLLQRHGSAAKLLAGGTDLLPRMKKRKNTPAVLIDLNMIPELSFIELRGDTLHIGAGTSFTEIYESTLVSDNAGALAEAVRVMASPGIRNRATIGGNLCNASRCADAPPPLLALDAAVKLRSAHGERLVSLAEFFTIPAPGCGKTITRTDEVMTEVVVPRGAGRSTFLKLGRRKGSSISIASAAAYAEIVDGKFAGVRIVVGGIGSTPIRGARVEKALQGAAARAENIESASALIKEEINPLSDVRASAAYRREIVPVLIERVLKKIAMGE